MEFVFSRISFGFIAISMALLLNRYATFGYVAVAKHR